MMAKTTTDENLLIWSAVEKTDPRYTKSFNRAGGFKGTATNATWLSKAATSIFGPNGIGWGLVIEDEKYVEGAPIHGAKGDIVCREIIHVLRAHIWYVNPSTGEKASTSPQFGQTTFVGKNKYGVYTDEEAPKKSATDVMTKCLSLLGFAADVHLGMYDDNKYVSDLRAEFQNGKTTAPTPSQDKQKQNAVLLLCEKLEKQAAAGCRWASNGRVEDVAKLSDPELEALYQQLAKAKVKAEQDAKKDGPTDEQQNQLLEMASKAGIDDAEFDAKNKEWFPDCGITQLTKGEFDELIRNWEVEIGKRSKMF